MRLGRRQRAGEMERDAMIAPNAGAPKRRRTPSQVHAFEPRSSLACDARRADTRTTERHRTPSSAAHPLCAWPFNFDSFRM
jgi:hypothetical protein